MNTKLRLFVWKTDIEFPFSGHSDAGEGWRARYEDEALIEKVDKLWDEVQPLYNELHKYVRNQLGDLYGDKLDKNNDFIPAHLLGNMWVSDLWPLRVLTGYNFSSLTGAELGSPLRSHQALQGRLDD